MKNAETTRRGKSRKNNKYFEKYCEKSVDFRDFAKKQFSF